MAKTIGVFDFQGWGLGKAKPGEMRGQPLVALSLKTWTTWEKSIPTFTPQLATEEEVDSYVRLLQEDLAAAGARAKAALKKARSRS